MADTTLGVITGGGAIVNTFQRANTAHDQYVREVVGTAEADVFWTASLSATTSVVAADATRTGMRILNNSTNRVYLRFDTTAPTTALNGHHWYLEAGDRWEVPADLRTLPMSIIAATASGYAIFHYTTAA